MENQNNKNESTLASGILKIAKQVCEALKLTDESKINNFYQKVLKNLQREKSKLVKNIDIVRNNYHEQLEAIDEKIEDAEVRVEEAYRNVTVDNVSTNEKMTNYIDTFWATIDEAELELETLKSQKKDLNERLTSQIENLEKQVEEYNYRISKIEMK